MSDFQVFWDPCQNILMLLPSVIVGAVFKMLSDMYDETFCEGLPASSP